MTLLLAVLVACGGANPAREAIDAAATTQPAVAPARAGSFWCPMHPEVVQDGPGKCPKCAMDLVRKEG